DDRAPVSRVGSEYGIAFQPERAHRPPQIGDRRQIDASFGQASYDADLPRISRGGAAAENQGDVAGQRRAGVSA
ncbi:MAG: hypothetical protein ACYCPF_05455, partial [Streptosporangiaceae bacterium]